MDQKLCDTSISGDYLAKCLMESLGSNAILKSVIGEKFALGQGFVSCLLRVSLIWETPADNLPCSLILKVPHEESLNDLFDKTGGEYDAATQSNIALFVIELHQTECNIYHIFGQDPPIPLPKCFTAFAGNEKAPGVLIMEDMSSNASVIPSIVDGLSLPQILEATKALAKLHGWSLITSTDWRSRIKDLSALKSILEPMFITLLPGYETVKEKFPKQFGSIDVAKLRRLLSFDKMQESYSIHRPHMEDVLVHGDYWANNIMFEKKSDGTSGDRISAVIDFQLSSRGNPMVDLGRLMSWSVSQDIRRSHIDQILHHYYKNLKSIVGDKLTVDLTQMKEWYNQCFAFNVIWVLVSLPPLMESFVKSEGMQRIKDQNIFLDRMKAAYDDAMAIFRD
jgi:thiamine kinase-like enzyme